MLETREADYESARSAILRAAAQRKTIDVSDNRLASLPPEIGRLNNLSSLDVSNNRLTHLPAEIGQLTNLDALSLGDNQIANLPAEIGRLARLKLLDLVGNDLALLPPELSQLSDTVELRLAHNDLIEPLPELLARGIPTLLAYLRGVLESGAPVYEAKVLVVGEGNVGTGVRIIIVATHASERRREELDHSPLKRQFGDLLVDHCEVDNLAPTGIRTKVDRC